jgi:hypothetical protein
LEISVVCTFYKCIPDKAHQNGAVIEGWAVHTEAMMLENGWANGASSSPVKYIRERMLQ